MLCIARNASEVVGSSAFFGWDSSMSVDLPEYVGFNADTMGVVDVENDGASKVNREAHASGAVKEREGREENTLESRCSLPRVATSLCGGESA